MMKQFIGDAASHPPPTRREKQMVAVSVASTFCLAIGGVAVVGVPESDTKQLLLAALLASILTLEGSALLFYWRWWRTRKAGR